MAKVNASIPQGTRDFGPETVQKRNYILNTIRSVFELYGFQPLETPAMENIETLMGKYGEEGDKLIFKILNNGLNRPEKQQTANAAFQQVLNGKTNKDLTERALRYDLTIPFARYVAMNHGQLTLPFKRYQMQPVWRADKPQKGRYREFYQCDADVVGSHSLLNEVELLLLYATVFEKLGVDAVITINSRKILAALAEICGGADQLTNITIAIDKLDKIGMEKVKEELSQRGLTLSQINTIEQYLGINGSNENKLLQLKTLLQNNPSGLKGLQEIEYVLDYTRLAPDSPTPVLDLTLARGLNYYTGLIFEVKALRVQIGSIGGGGRYDDLTGTFGLPQVPGIGISFGVDRIYDVMEEQKLFPVTVAVASKALFFNLGEAAAKNALVVLQQLRAAGTSCELYHEETKFDKQFKYAEKKNIPFVIIIGSKEMETVTCVVKNLQTGLQEIIQQQDLALYLQ